MVDKDQTIDETPAAVPAPAPRRGPGHRGADMRDTVAEMAERAQLISQEAGSKVSSAMKDVISAAAGLAGFAIESARDLVQYMVRRGQMTQEEADKLIREAEDAHSKKPASEKARPTASKIAAERAAVEKVARDAANAAAAALAPPTRPGAFSLRTGGPRAVVRPAAPAAPFSGSSSLSASLSPTPAAPPAVRSAAPVKPAVKAPAKPAAKATGKSAAKSAAKAPSKGGAAAKSASKSSAKAGAKATAKSKPAGKAAKPAGKKKR